MKLKARIISLVVTGVAASLGLMLLFRLVMVRPAEAATCNVPTGTHSTIQSAVDDVNCDTVNLTAALYTENVTINRSVSIQGQGMANTVVDGAATNAVFTIDHSVNVIITALTIRNGNNSVGGGIFNQGNLALEQLLITGNTGVLGGAITSVNGLLTINDSIIADNKSTTDFSPGAGGIFLEQGSFVMSESEIRNNLAIQGTGGISLRSDAASPVSATLQRVAVHGNEVTTTIGGTNVGGLALIGSWDLQMDQVTISNNIGLETGGVHFALYAGGSASLRNSTVSGNQATAGHDGTAGGIRSSGLVMLYNVTISANSTAAGIGGIAVDSGTTQIQNSILAGNIGNEPDCRSYNQEFQSLGHNLIGVLSTNCSLVLATGDLTNLNPLLGSLRDNGGLTWTHALLWGSPAIDAGNNENCPAVDQRGFPRPLDGDGDGDAVCDIGAYEYKILPPRLYLPLVSLQ